MKSHAEHWRKQVMSHLGSYHEVAAGPLKAAEIDHGTVSGDLNNGFRLVYAGEHELARRFFERTIEAASVALEGEQLEKNALWPSNRGELLVYEAVARGCVSGGTGSSSFSKASADFVEATSTLPRFNHLEREQYLWAIRCALVADDEARARELMDAQWARLRRHEEGELLRKLAKRDETVLAALDDYFERAREPRSHVVTMGSLTHPLELGILRDKLLEPGKQPDWLKLVARVGA